MTIEALKRKWAARFEVNEKGSRIVVLDKVASKRRIFIGPRANVLQIIDEELKQRIKQ